MLKKIVMGLAAIVVSSAALAHGGRDHERERHHRFHHHFEHHHHGWREHRPERFHEGRHRPVVVERERHVFVAPPRATASVDVHVPF